MKKPLTILAICIAILFGSTYFIFNNEVEAAKLRIADSEKQQKEAFLKKKNEVLSDFLIQYPNQSDLFNYYFEQGKANYQQDTLVHFFVYGSKLSKIRYEEGYLSCLVSVCETDIKNTSTRDSVGQLFEEFRGKYGERVNSWIQRIGTEKFTLSLSSTKECSQYFEKQVKDIKLNNAAFAEFRAFLAQVAKEERTYERKSYQAASIFQNKLQKAHQGLTSAGRKMLDQRISTRNFIREGTTDLNFNGKELGMINYSFPTKEFSEAEFNSILNKVYIEQYQNNVLRNGTMPYAYCFGSSNSCSEYGCSEIRVRTPHNSDVVVTIKRNDRVYRHAYIQANRSYAFKFPNGTYQAFFYYGKGWNPHKFMKNTTCGKLKGGFVSNEHFGKDSPQSLYNQILSYELILQQNGNFSTRPSNREEAF